MKRSANFKQLQRIYLASRKKCKSHGMRLPNINAKRTVILDWLSHNKILWLKGYYYFVKDYENSRTIHLHPLDNYGKVGRHLGEGTYGKVVSLKKEKTIVMKIDKEPVPSASFVIEVAMLSRLRHPHIINIIDVVAPYPGTMDLTRAMILERKKGDIIGYFKGEYESPFDPVKISYQLLSALAYLHERRVVHRDIRPENILLDSVGDAILCDFGVALDLGNKNLMGLYPTVNVLEYRAPELILGSTSYDGSIDMWAIACTIWELFNRRHLFPGADDDGMLGSFVALLGFPRPEDYPDIRSYNIFVESALNQEQKPQNKRRFLKKTMGRYAPLVGAVLVYNPRHRATAAELLSAPFFSTFHTVTRKRTGISRERYPLSSIEHRKHLTADDIAEIKKYTISICYNLQSDLATLFKAVAIFDQVMNAMKVKRKYLHLTAYLSFYLASILTDVRPIDRKLWREFLPSDQQKSLEDGEVDRYYVELISGIKYNLCFATIFNYHQEKMGDSTIHVGNRKLVEAIMLLGLLTNLCFRYLPSVLYELYQKVAMKVSSESEKHDSIVTDAEKEVATAINAVILAEPESTIISNYLEPNYQCLTLKRVRKRIATIYTDID